MLGLRSNNMIKIFFQGDSITDALRDRKDNHFLNGYSLYAKEYLGDGFEYVNYGISGDTSRSVLKRHEQEFLKEKPDILVLMIGINDVWRSVDHVVEEMTTSDEFINNVKKTLEISKNINPKVKILFLEPYLLPGPNNVYQLGFDLYKYNIGLLRKFVKPMVDQYIVLQDDIFSAMEKGVALTTDGIHPNDEGAQYLGKVVASAVKSII